MRTFIGTHNRIEQTKDQIEAKWISRRGTRMAYPQNNGQIEDNIRMALKQTCIGRVCEIGCGTGRIASVFSPKSYIGLDINPFSLEIAEKRHPNHAFDLIMWETIYPGADTYLFFTVLLHIPDSELFGIIRRLDNRVVIVEAMGSWLRDYGRDNNYQRDPDDYRKEFKRIGMKEQKFVHCGQAHFPYYLDFMVFE